MMSDEEFTKTYLSQVEGYIKRCEEERKHLVGNIYPYLMVMCGSAFAYVKVSEHDFLFVRDVFWVTICSQM